MSDTASSVRRDGERVVFTGTLDRGAVTGLWPQATVAATGAQVLDVSNVASVDSAGVAMLVALAARMAAVRVEGAPTGMADLLAAYRLQPTFGFEENQ